MRLGDQVAGSPLGQARSCSHGYHWLSQQAGQAPGFFLTMPLVGELIPCICSWELPPVFLFFKQTISYINFSYLILFCTTLQDKESVLLAVRITFTLSLCHSVILKWFTTYLEDGTYLRWNIHLWPGQYYGSILVLKGFCELCNRLWIVCNAFFVGKLAHKIPAFPSYPLP